MNEISIKFITLGYKTTCFDNMYIMSYYHATFGIDKHFVIDIGKYFVGFIHLIIEYHLTLINSSKHLLF